MLKKFSQRLKITPVKLEIQKGTIDIELRNAIWNGLKIFLLDKVNNDWISRTEYSGVFKIIWHDFFKLSLDELDNYYPTTYKFLRKWFYECNWYEVYDFIEFVANTPIEKYEGRNDKFINFCNNMLEREISAYRFVDGYIVEITNESEIKEIETAISNSQNFRLNGVQTHLKNALEKLSDKKNPDYRNSIKESISAVESITKIISGEQKAELGKALKLINDKIGIHPALSKGFLSIYGYTSDEDGIRHAMLEEKDIDFTDAKYMLVSCSAFINYLILKAEKAHIKINSN